MEGVKQTLRPLAYSFALFGVFAAGAAVAAESRPNRPDVLGIEFFGRVIGSSLFYDRAAGPDWAVGAGIGKLGVRAIGGADLGESAALMVPLYANYYLAREHASIFLTIGATIMAGGAQIDRQSASGNLIFPDNALLPNFGVGYESRSNNGFLLRVTGYLIHGKTIVPWVGGSLGLAF